MKRCEKSKRKYKIKNAPKQVGNGPLHSPDGKQIDSEGPFRP